MERRTVFITLIFIFLYIRRVHTTNRIFTCGIINEYPVEFDAVNFGVSNTSSLNNMTIVLKQFNVSENIELFNQALMFRQQNILALIEGSHTNNNACALSTVTGIPLIRLHGNSGPLDQCEKAVQMSAGYSDYAHASLDILNTFRWEKIALVFDESRLHEAGYFHAISQKLLLTVDFVHLSPDTKTEDGDAPVLKAMDEIKSLEPDIILLYTSIKNIELMLQQKPCKCNTGYKWILQGRVPPHLQCHPNNVIVAMKLPYTESQATKKLENITLRNSKGPNKDMVTLAYDSVEVINQALNMEPCASINGTAITSSDRQTISTCLRKVNMDGLTGSVQFSENGNRKEVNLEILNLQNNSFKQIGTWNSTIGTVMFGNVLRNVRTSSSRSTLEGRKLRVVVVEEKPFVVKKEENGYISYDGYCIDLLHELARNLKFTFEINPSPDGFFGAKTANGTWNGLIGELVNERADIAVASLTVTEAREKVVDFTIPYMFYTEDIIMKKTSFEKKHDLLQFMAPFHSNVWCCTLSIVIIISVAVFVINYFSPYGYKDENGQGTSEEFNYFNSLWFAFACMLQQGGDNTPRSLSGRILAGCYWFCILIWVSTYTANLAAFFTVKNAEQVIQNLEDLSKSTYQVGILDSSSVYEAFESSQYETHKKIWQRMQAGNTFAKSTSQALRWVREKENFVFIHDGPTLKHVANQPPCDLKIVPGLSSAKGLSFAFQPNDPHTHEITLAILRLQESNFVDGLRRKWWEMSNSCPEEEDTTLSRKQIGLWSMAGVYIVLGVGMVIAIVTLIAEIYWNRSVKQKLINKLRRGRTMTSSIKVVKENNNERIN